MNVKSKRIRKRKKRTRPVVQRPRLFKLPGPGALLVDRRQTAVLLGGVSTSTLVRMEKLGVLDPKKPSGCENGKTYYATRQVRALAEDAR